MLQERDFSGTPYVPVYVMLPVSSSFYSSLLHLTFKIFYIVSCVIDIAVLLLRGQLEIINMECELVNADDLLNQLKILKSQNVDGVMVDCWWGIVEAHAPQQYNWNGYKKLFQIVRDLKLKIQVCNA